MQQITRKSAVPLYGVAMVWLLCAFAFPFYKLWHILLAAAVSVAVYLILAKICPGKTVEVKEWEKPAESGDSQADALIQEGRNRLKQLQELNDAIADPQVSAHIARIQEISGKIFSYIGKNPDQVQQVRRFMNYYLPTAIKLLQSYQDMADQGVSGQNITSTMAQVKGILGTVVQAFEKQLDSLFADQALDISTDITVLEGMLAREGLVEDEISGMKHRKEE